MQPSCPPEADLRGLADRPDLDSALLFFQSTCSRLCLADVDRLGVRRQTLLHIGLLMLSLAALPILASADWKPRGDEDPIVRILLLLTVTIGLPYFLLSTTTPLLQSWYWRRFRAVVPYRLFALSNFASLLALLGFPVLLEPWLGLIELGWAWSIAYGAFALLCAGTAWTSLKSGASSLRPAGNRDSDCDHSAERADAAHMAGAGREWLRSCCSPSPITSRRHRQRAVFPGCFLRYRSTWRVSF